MSSCLCVIEGSRPDERLVDSAAALGRAAAGYSDVELIVFADDPGRTLSKAFRASCPQVRLLPAAELLTRSFQPTLRGIEAFTESLRRKLTAVVRDYCGERKAGAFAELWWYGKLSERNVLGEDEWWHLFRYAGVRQAMASSGATRLMMVGSRALDTLFRCSDIDPGRYDGRTLRETKPKTLTKLLRKRFKRGWRQLGAARLARAQAGSATRADTILVSGYPRMWTERFSVRTDMYYGRLADELQRLGCRCGWWLNLHDNTDAGVAPKTYREYLERLDGESIPEPEVTEGSIPVWDGARTYLDVSMVRALLKIRRRPETRACFDWQGTNLHALLMPMLEESMISQWPYYQCLEGGYARLAAQTRPKRVVLYTFEYRWGRAWVRGIRRGSPETGIAGIQHGPGAAITQFGGCPEELAGEHPVPLPDLVCADGPANAMQLRRRGLSEGRTPVCGAARFDSLWEAASERAGSDRAEADEPCRVLVAPGLHDTRFVISFVTEALADTPGVEVLVRPHPKVSDEAVRSIMKEAGARKAGNIRMERSGTIYDSMRSAELFLATYSSTGVESLAFGVPTIILRSGRVADVSLFAFTETPAEAVETVEALREAVSAMAADPQARAAYLQSQLPALERSFHLQDGLAARRQAKAVVKTPGR